MENFIKQKISEGASKIAENAVENIACILPDDNAKKDFLVRMKNITAEGIYAVIDGQEYQSYLERGAYETSVFLANHYADAALNRLCEELPQGKTRQIVTDALYEISHSSIEIFCSGGSLDEVKAELSTIAKNQFKNYAAEQIQNFSQNAGNGIYKKIKFSGGGSRTKNKYLREGTDLIAEEFNSQVTDNLGEVIFGNKDFDTAAKDIIIGTGKNSAVSYGKKKIVSLAKIGGDELYKKIKFSGSGSRSKNKYLREGTDLIAEEFTFQVTENLEAILDGRKNLDAAAKDIVVHTGKNFAVNYGKKQGAEIAAQAINRLSKLAEKEIKNKIAKNAVTSFLDKLADSNTLIQIAGAAYDIGKSLRRWLDNEISDAEFLREVGQKGTEVIVSGVFATLGAGVAGPVGAAIGSAVGYFATNLLYGAVLQSFEEAELSRKRYEAIHAFCEESIREMELQRQEFECKVAQFLSHRQAVIDNSLNAFEAALRNNDMTGVSSALNEIAMEFGGELEFKNRAEFDKCMLDKNYVFVL